MQNSIWIDIPISVNQRKPPKSFYISYLGRFIDITSSSKVLEIGCGEGGTYSLLRRKVVLL